VSDGALQVFFFAKLGLTFAYLCVNPASMLISLYIIDFIMIFGWFLAF
jgi:hypothetical protein